MMSRFEITAIVWEEVEAQTMLLLMKRKKQKKLPCSCTLKDLPEERGFLVWKQQQDHGS